MVRDSSNSAQVFSSNPYLGINHFPINTSAAFLIYFICLEFLPQLLLKLLILYFHLQPNLVTSGASDSEIYIWDLLNPVSPMTPGSKSQVFIYFLFY